VARHPRAVDFRIRNINLGINQPLRNQRNQNICQNQHRHCAGSKNGTDDLEL